MLGATLKEKLLGKTMSVGDVKEFVLTSTPSYQFKDALSGLEKEGSVEPVNAPPKRRPGTYPDEELLLRFGNAKREVQLPLF